MTKIYSYKKIYTEYTIIQLIFPHFTEFTDFCTELCTIDGITYVSIPDTILLPDQPPEIQLTEVILNDALKQQIKDNSCHVGLINSRVQEMISKKYSIQDEIKLIRTAPTPEYTVYNDYVESCRTWGRNEKAKLGL